MSLMGEAWRRFLFLLRRSHMDRELQEEMRHHAALKAEKHIALGMEPEEAKYTAQRQLGNLTRQREESRQNWGFPFLESIVQDIRYGLRGLRNAPGFTTVAALTLALGIGSCTAIFSIVNALVLRPLPYKDSSRMVMVGSQTPMFPEFRLPQALPNANDIKALARSFEATTLFQPEHKKFTGNDGPEQLAIVNVSSDFFAFFGVHPIQGREFDAGDQQMNSGNVALLSYGLWQRRFGGDATMIGRTIVLEQKPYTVVGVLPAEFSYPRKTDIWLPLVINAEEQSNRQRWFYSMLAKLRPGIAVRNAQSELDGIAAAIAQQHPDEASGIKFPMTTLQDMSLGEERTQLLVSATAVSFLLLIAGANVSNLMLSRGIKRQREIAVRAALGASRARIVRQLLIESLLLAFAGGVAGSAFGTLGVDAFRALVPASFPRLEDLKVEPATLWIACAITALAGILCGLAPAISASRANLNPALKEKTGAVTSRRFSLRGFLVVTEVASALILLTGSALMVQSLVRTLRVDTGLRIDHVLAARVELPKDRYATEDASRIFTQRLMDALRAQPQFVGVALSDVGVMDSSLSTTSLEPSTLAALGIKDKILNLEIRSVSPGFFETLAVRLVRGRFFDNHDTKGSTPVIIINDSVAQRLFPGQDPIGKVLPLGLKASDRYQIIGQVPDTRDVDLRGRRELQVYFSLLQHPGTEVVHILARTTAEPSASVAYLRSAVGSVDKDLPLAAVHTIAQAISESVAQPRFRAWMLSAFAFAGLALTLIGIYGVISYSVGQRTQEMGIRMALGAQPWNVLRLVLREGIVLALSGAVCGVLGSFMLMRLLANQLFSIKPSDPPTLIGAALLMLIVALAASYIPARRATKVDPMIALRYE